MASPLRINTREQRLKPALLVVDEGLEWRDVDDAEGLRGVISECGADREEGGLCFPGRRRGRDQHVKSVEDRCDSPHLDIA